MGQIESRLEYYVTLARLLSEAEAQTQADADDLGSRDYAEDLAVLRSSLRTAADSAAAIAVDLAQLRIRREFADEEAALLSEGH